MCQTLRAVIAALPADFESWSNVAANAAQIAAIAVGGWWAYSRFIRQREEFPRADLEQVVTHMELDRKNTFLRVTVKVDNVSTVMLRTETVRTDVYQVLPLTDAAAAALSAGTLVTEGERDARWPCIASYEGPGPGQIEPGEGDEFGFDFVLGGDVETLFIYSYIKNVAQEGRELGWGVTSLYDLDEARGEQRERAESRPARRQP
jgi:hypothetical protein